MPSVSKVASPLNLGPVAIKNRLGLSPMCQYESDGGFVGKWHLQHYGSRSHGVGLTVVEATAISPEGRVTLEDLGAWNDCFIPGLTELASMIEEQGSVPGIQLCHGGRKASRTRPSDGDEAISIDDGGWVPLSVTDEPFADGYVEPQPMSVQDIEKVIQDFVDAARRAREAGFRVVELHAGHGRLLHCFYSPISNTRDDRYGGSFENRIRLLVEVVSAVSAEIGHDCGLAVRLSATDWLDGGWKVEDSVRLATRLKQLGVNLVDCSTSGIKRPISVPTGPCYQVGFAERVKSEAGISTAAVGMISTTDQVSEIIDGDKADMVFLGRCALRDPLTVVEMLNEMSGTKDATPPAYARAFRSTSQPKRTGDEHIPEL